MVEAIAWPDNDPPPRRRPGRWRQFLTALTPSGPSYQPAPKPYRGDTFETWLKARRDDYLPRTDEWIVVDDLLDTYRLHAATRTPLHEHVCEGGNVDDCAGCYDAMDTTW